MYFQLLHIPLPAPTSQTCGTSMRTSTTRYTTVPVLLPSAKCWGFPYNLLAESAQLLISEGTLNRSDSEVACRKRGMRLAEFSTPKELWNMIATWGKVCFLVGCLLGWCGFRESKKRLVSSRKEHKLNKVMVPHTRLYSV